MARLQPTTRQRDHQCVVAGQQHVDPDDLADRDPKSRLRHLAMKLADKVSDGCRIEDLQQPVHSAFLSASRPSRAAIGCRSPYELTDDFVAREKLGDFEDRESV